MELREIPLKIANELIVKNYWTHKVGKPTKYNLGIYIDGDIKGVLQLGWGVNPKETQKKVKGTKPNEWLEFTKVNVTSLAKPLEKFPNGNRNANYLKTLNAEPPHDYYKFHQNDKCHIFPPQRLFNNVTKRSCLPSPHFTQDIAPIYLG